MATIQETLTKLPHAPGVYLFSDDAGTVIYVGKAKDLWNRVHQYFIKNPDDPKLIHLVPQIHTIDIRPVPSEFDALLLEAELIRTLQPKYNRIAKDDKSPLYVVLTLSEELPHVVVIRKRDMGTVRVIHKKDKVFGPFASAKLLRSMLATIRTSIPFCTAKIRTGRPCFYTHIGLCTPCPSTIARLPESDEKQQLVQTYRRNIQRIADIFSGKGKLVLQTMKREMDTYAKNQQFEDAQTVKVQLSQLQGLYARRFDPMVFTNAQLLPQVYTTDLMDLTTILRPYYPDMKLINRIECIDIANLGAANPTASLVVSLGGQPDRSEYKRFRMKYTSGPNDVGMIAEVVARRIKHTEWPLPGLLVIDGGKGQVAAAREVLLQNNVAIPLIGLAKREEIIVVPTDLGWKEIILPFRSGSLHLLQRLRDEAHRFARNYHHLLRSKALIK